VADSQGISAADSETLCDKGSRVQVWHKRCTERGTAICRLDDEETPP
jgi:hypothetical protein